MFVERDSSLKKRRESNEAPDDCNWPFGCRRDRRTADQPSPTLSNRLVVIICLTTRLTIRRRFDKHRLTCDRRELRRSILRSNNARTYCRAPYDRNHSSDDSTTARQENIDREVPAGIFWTCFPVLPSDEWTLHPSPDSSRESRRANAAGAPSGPCNATGVAPSNTATPKCSSI